MCPLGIINSPRFGIRPHRPVTGSNAGGKGMSANGGTYPKIVSGIQDLLFDQPEFIPPVFGPGRVVVTLIGRLFFPITDRRHPVPGDA